MTHDRSYYRALSVGMLLAEAEQLGLNPEISIAITERLGGDRYRGKIQFTEREIMK